MIKEILDGGFIDLSKIVQCGCTCQCGNPGGYSEGYRDGTRDGAKEKTGIEEQV